MATHHKRSRDHQGDGRTRPVVAARPAGPSTTSVTWPVTDTAWHDLALRAAVIVLAIFWIYAPVSHPVVPPEWHWDDDTLLTANPTVQTTTAAALAKLWFNPDGADYFPLSYTALWLQWPLFKTWSTGYHLVSITLHALASLLLWRLLAAMRIPGAWLAGALFAVHPVCVESVAWVSELKNTLSLPLVLLAAVHFVQFDEIAHDTTGTRRPSGEGHYWLALGLFLLSMFAKTSVVMLPVVLLVHAWWKRGRVTARDAVRAAPFFLVSLVLGIVTLQFQHDRAIGDEPIPVGGALSRIATAGLSILWYLRLIVWPVDLLPIYPRWEVDPPRAWQFLAWIPIVGGLWACWAHRDAAGPRGWEHWGRHVLFALGFFLLMVLPVLGFVTIAYMRITWAADHFIYLPMIGPIALVAAGLVTGAERLPAVPRPWLLAAAACLLGVLATLSYRYAGAWVNEDTLWTHTLERNPDAWQAHNRLGARKFARGHVDDMPPADDVRLRGAMYHFTRSTALRPDLGETHNNLGTALMSKGRFDEAIAEFTEAIRVTPQDLRIRVNLANALASTGRFDEAAVGYEALLRIEPTNPLLLNNYGFALYRMGRRDEAIQSYRRALEIAPNLKDAREGLAIALGEMPDPHAKTPAPAAPPTAAPPTAAPPPAAPPTAAPPPATPAPPPLDLRPPTSPTRGPALAP
jgi:cytochrome c-type biogenesis protein CcmH/NrfG